MPLEEKWAARSWVTRPNIFSSPSLFSSMPIRTKNICVVELCQVKSPYFFLLLCVNKHRMPLNALQCYIICSDDNKKEALEGTRKWKKLGNTMFADKRSTKNLENKYCSAIIYKKHRKNCECCPVSQLIVR